MGWGCGAGAAPRPHTPTPSRLSSCREPCQSSERRIGNASAPAVALDYTTIVAAPPTSPAGVLFRGLGVIMLARLLRQRGVDLLLKGLERQRAGEPRAVDVKHRAKLCAASFALLIAKNADLLYTCSCAKAQVR